MPTALIVEDEPEANKLLGMLVQLRGYETQSALDGAAALEHVRNGVPDVIFLDLMLPDADGYDVCRSLKSSGTTSQIPVIIVTARIAAENRIESFRAGADDFIPKPYTPDQIFAALEEAQGWRQQLAAPRAEGEAVLDGRDDGETLRRLAGLRNLLMARSGLGHEAIEEIARAIRAIWSSVEQWARRGGLEQVATLRYSLTDECLTLTVLDEGGWIDSLRQARPDPLAELVGGARFDEVVADSASQSLRLVKRFQ